MLFEEGICILNESIDLRPFHVISYYRGTRKVF